MLDGARRGLERDGHRLVGAHESGGQPELGHRRRRHGGRRTGDAVGAGGRAAFVAAAVQRRRPERRERDESQECDESEAPTGHDHRLYPSRAPPSAGRSGTSRVGIPLSRVTSDLLLRLGVGVGLLVALALIELVLPWRKPRLSRPRRWGHNLGLALVDVGVSKLVLPLGLVGVALFAAERGWGLLPALDAPPLVAGVVSFLALDLVVYLQHRVFHAVPLLWRFHGIHHADGELDVTTGDRFHPVEVAISLGTQSAVVALLGAPPTAALVFQLVLNAGSLFTHANLDLPRGLDRSLRLLFVTPAVHRVHHSAAPGEADHNFGFNILLWDRFFGTYRHAPAAGETALRLGIDGLTRGDGETFSWVVLSPFRRRDPPTG